MTLTTTLRTTSLIIVVGLVLTACGNHVYHRVERGDSLYSIGWQYDQDYRQVAAWNNLKPPYVLSPGVWLRVAPPPHMDVPAEGQVPSEGRFNASYVPDTRPSTDSAGSRKRPPPLHGARPEIVVPPTRGKSKSPQEPVTPVIAASAVPMSPTATKSSPGIAPQVWRWPTRGELVRPFAADEPGKKGVDIRGRLGQPIWSAAAGRVVYGGNGLAAYGNLLIIKHDDNYLTAYAHNHKLRVQEGDTVVAGQHIADMGKSGTEQVKLHFEIRYQGKPVDPLRYLPAAP